MRRRSTADEISGLDAVEEFAALSCGDTQRCTTSGELTEHHMQPAHGLGAQTGEVVVPVGQQPQHRSVIVAFDTS